MPNIVMRVSSPVGEFVGRVNTNLDVSLEEAKQGIDMLSSSLQVIESLSLFVDSDDSSLFPPEIRVPGDILRASVITFSIIA